MTGPPTRREYLAAIGAASILGLAGCSSSETDEAGTDATEATSEASDDEGTADDSTQDDGETGDGYTQPDAQPTNRVQVVSAAGTDISGGTVGRVEVVVKRAPGSGDIDLSTTVLQFVHSSGSTDLTFGSTGGAGSTTEFGIESIQDEGETSLVGDSPTLDDPADRALLVLDTRDIISSGGGLSEGDTATVRLTTEASSTTELRLLVPQTLSGMDAVNLN